MTLESLRTRRALVVALLIPIGLAGCSSHSVSTPSESASAAVSASGECPGKAVDVVVSVDQWGDIVSALGGKCANVKTILASSSVDPHDYEPSPSDASTFQGAQLVVINGADYDAWASKIAGTSAPKAVVVDAAVVSDTPPGGNPHLWYSPSVVTAMADSVTQELTKIQPEAKAYFADMRAKFTTDLDPYTTLIGKIKAAAAGKTYAATEDIFDYQAQALGLVDKTPLGYRTASANESDPSPADIAAFTKALADQQINVLIYNTQTEGSIPEQIRTAAEQANVPVVNVTETVAPGQTSFQGWQDEQLSALAKALGVQV